MLNGRRIVLFTRGPRREARVKGLAAGAVRLFRRLARSWADAAKRVGATFEVSCPEGREEELRSALGNRELAVRPQSGGTFGDRLVGAVDASLDSGDAVLVVGGDVPAPDLKTLARAFAHLESDARAAVLEPSLDGGVNAIGLRGDAEQLLAGISWGTDRVGAELTARCLAAGMPLCELEPRLDVDNGDAARRAISADVAWQPFESDLVAACASPILASTPPVSFEGISHVRDLAARGPPASA